jgi:SAM-dependent methyltransferase
MAAVNLGVFDALADGPLDAAALAERLGLDPVGIEAVLASLASLGYVEGSVDGSYRVSDVSARLLVRSSPETIATGIGAFNLHTWDTLGKLEDALRGEPPRGWHRAADDDPFWEAYMRGLFELSRGEHDLNAAAISVAEPRRMLDVAGGHGAFSMAMCRRHPGLRVTIVDLPASAAVGRQIVAEEGFADRIGYLEGDVFEVDLGAGVDVVSAFNLMHHLPPDRVLAFMELARDALREQGFLVIGETERVEPGQEVPPHAGAMGGVIFFASSRTRNYSREEIADWLGQAGFERPSVHRNERSPWRLLYVARKASA